MRFSRHMLRQSGITLAAVGLCIGPASADGFFGTVERAFNMEPAEDGWYVSAFVGAGFLGDDTFEGIQDPDPGIPSPAGNVAGVPAIVELDFNPDVFFGGSIGYKLPFTYLDYFHPRLELEVSYTDADVDEGGFFNDAGIAGGQTFSGDQEILFIFLNNHSDIRWRNDQKIVPYFGSGLGLGIVKTSISYFPPTAPGPVFEVDGDDVAFATNLNIGVTWEATERVEFYTESRYFTLYNVQADRNFIGGGAEIFNADLDDNVKGVTVKAGMRFNF